MQKMPTEDLWWVQHYIRHYGRSEEEILEI